MQTLLFFNRLSIEKQCHLNDVLVSSHVAGKNDRNNHSSQLISRCLRILWLFTITSSLATSQGSACRTFKEGLDAGGAGLIY